MKNVGRMLDELIAEIAVKCRENCADSLVTNNRKLWRLELDCETTLVLLKENCVRQFDDMSLIGANP